MSLGTDVLTESRSDTDSIFRRLSNGFGNLLNLERERWLIWTPVLLGIGVALYFALDHEPTLSSGLLAFGLTAALAGMSRHRPAVALGLTALSIIAAGFVAAEIRTAFVAAPILTEEIGPAFVSGRVEEVELQEKSARLLLADVHVSRLARDKTPVRIRVRLTPHSDLPKLGERISLIAKLYAPPVPAAPDAHDFRRDLYYQRIGAVGYAVKKFVEDSAKAGAAAPLLGRLRQDAGERITAVLSGPDQTAERAIALALLVGERGPIPEDVNNQMRDAGLAHLLAISGMNITIAAGLIYFTLRLLLAAIPYVALRLPIKKIAAAGGLLGAIAYTEFVGAPISAERSMITTSFFMVAVMLDRSAITLRLVALSASLLLIFEPEALMGASFQMSYGAIVALVVLYERWQFRGHGGGGGSEAGVLRRMLHYLGGIAVMTIVASSATAVFAIYHFQQSAFYGVGANLLAVPVHDLFIMPLGILSYFLMPFGLEALALKPMAWGIHEMLWTAQVFSGFPGASAQFQAMPAVGLGLIVMGGLWFLLWTQTWRWLGLAPVVAGIVATLISVPPDILISPDGKLVAVRQPGGEIALSNRQHDKFIQSVWVRRAGGGDIEARTGDKTLPKFAEGQDAADCKKGVCRFTVAGHKAAIVTDPKRLKAGCADADIVIGPVAAHDRCAASLVIDQADLARDGATAIRFENGVPRIETVRETAGQRPWVVAPSVMGE